MKNKYLVIVLNLFIAIISIYFTYAVYVEYKMSQQIKIENYIKKSIKQNEEAVVNAFLKIKSEIEKDKKLFQAIHEEYTLKLRKNPNLSIFDLKQEIHNKYNLKEKEVQLFILNDKYTVIRSTYEPDIGFNLSDVTDARKELDRAEDGKVYQSASISIDLINSEVKSYSYSKLNDKFYFEMGFINYKINTVLKSTMKKIQIITNQKSNLYRIEQKTDGSEYYDNILDKNIDKTKEEYLVSKKKFAKDEKIDDLVILSNREGRAFRKYLDNALIVYIPLIKKKNQYIEVMGDFVLELYIDRTFEKELTKKVENYFKIFLVFHLFFLIIIYYFTKKYYDTQSKLFKKVEENDKLLKENKDFISGMTHQIEAPLSVIINNYELIKKDIPNSFKKYDEQISSSINMLETSYEDLNYIITNEKLKYPTIKIDLSSFLKKRVDFFNVIARSKGGNISFEIINDIFIKINIIQLERLIDNNFSNAIKYSNRGSKIFISLSVEEKNVYLKFYSYSPEIKNKEKIFEKNYQEKHTSKKSLGLGLSMVKAICKKYDIKYKVEYKNHQNIFVYDMTSLVVR